MPAPETCARARQNGRAKKFHPRGCGKPRTRHPRPCPPSQTRPGPTSQEDLKSELSNLQSPILNLRFDLGAVHRVVAPVALVLNSRANLPTSFMPIRPEEGTDETSLHTRVRPCSRALGRRRLRA